MAQEENLKQEEDSLTTETPLIPIFKKRKRLSLSRLKEIKASLPLKQKQSDCLSISYGKCKPKKNANTIERWSAERYAQAEKSMLEVMKAEGATFANPVSRPLLRVAARRHIGDTGLLDHLLKHIDGRVAPGGAERFRRWFNTNGIMEYWLENADLVNIRQEAGVHDPYWIPQRKSIVESDSAVELKLLKVEMTRMKREMQELASKISNQQQLNSMEVILREVVEKEAKTEERLNEIAGCLKGVQGVLSEELMTWRTKVELQLIEISNSLGCVHPSKQRLLSPSERWEGWLESTNLDNLKEEELASWFEGNNMITIEKEAVDQDCLPASYLMLKCEDNLTQDQARTRELEPLKALSKSNSDVIEVGLGKQEDDGAHVTPDSSVTGNSKSELDTSVHMFQEMFQELFSWKARMEQHVMELSNSVRELQKDQSLVPGLRGN